MPFYYGTVREPNGDVSPSASVYIYGTGGTTASTIYSEESLTTTTTNPITAGSDGTFSFYAAPGEYRILAKDFEGDTVFDDDPVVIGMYMDGFASDTIPGGLWFSSGVKIFYNDATPEGEITAPPGSFCMANVADTGTVYVKTTGTGNTGWEEVTAGANPTNPTGKTYYGVYDDAAGTEVRVYSYSDGTVTTTPISTIDYSGEPWNTAAGVGLKFFHDFVYNASENALFGITADGLNRSYVVKFDLDTDTVSNSGLDLAGADHRGCSTLFVLDDVLYTNASNLAGGWDVITCSVTDISAANWAVMTTVTESAYTRNQNNGAPSLWMVNSTTPLVAAYDSPNSAWLTGGTDNAVATISSTITAALSREAGFPGPDGAYGFVESYYDGTSGGKAGVLKVDSNGAETQVTPEAWTYSGTKRFYLREGGLSWVIYNQSFMFYTRVDTSRPIDSGATQDTTSIDLLPGSLKPDDFIPVD